MHFETQLVHSAGDHDPTTGAVGVPVYQASTFNWADLDHPGRYDYARAGNPTREALEQTIANLEGGCQGFAFASGMAAISTVLSLFSAGDHLVVADHVYGGADRVLTRVFNRFGISNSFVDASDTEAIAAAVRPNTKAVYLETPSNPFLSITDLRAAAALAQARGLLSIVDNTFMTPYLQQPLALGCDVVVHSATKFLGGHSDVVAGLAVARDEQVASRIGLLQKALGAILGPHDAWLVLRGIKTLQVRLDREQATAQRLAEWLNARPEVSTVYYPGLPTHPGYDIHNSQAAGSGAVLSFRLGSPEVARTLYARRRLPALAVSLGGVESILSVPARMSHAALSPERKRELGIDDTLARLSVGLEHPDDLIADLAEAFA
ncbi:MAG: trans-sulfuration enzyme family protein [Chloroflexota bacterium]